MTEPIPNGPPGLPLVGNVFDVDPRDSLLSIIHLCKIYGPVFRLRLPGSDEIVIAEHSLYDELCDEKRFTKKIGASLDQVRNGVHDGLFTAYPHEHNWEVAHRILVPAFGPLSIRNMFDEMHDISIQLVLKWARYGDENVINVTDDFTRLTLDSIALCAMGTRFNSFYTQEMNPFVTAMVDFLLESGRRGLRSSFVNSWMRSSEKKYFENIELMRSMAMKMVEHRKANPNNKKDLVNAMLNGKDPKTGEKMSDDSIAYNMITFLIAGHETTSGTLSFLFYRLCSDPRIMEKAQKEVDEVVGKGPITVEHLSKLPYINACLRETLRLTPTASQGFMSAWPESKEDPIIIGGKYRVDHNQTFRLVLPMIHRDPKVYGDDAEEFKPERMLDENFKKLPKNAWKPFGNGQRGCIGRDFAWQEMLLCIAMLLQNFHFRHYDPNYKLSIRQTLTIKPKGFFMYANLRPGIDVSTLEKNLSNAQMKHEATPPSTPIRGTSTAKKLMAVFFGGNMGTCESLAQKIAQSAADHGYQVDIKPLDDATSDLPKDVPILIISSSYEGEPPDNAGQFVHWLEDLKSSGTLKGVKYGVFGCGNRDWKATFQRIPKLIDSLLEENGGKRIVNRGLADAADNDIFNDFEKWEDNSFWPQISKYFGEVKSEGPVGLDVEVSTTLRSSHLRQDVREAIVLKNEVLTSSDDPAAKRYMELKLPTDMEYRAGDYLAVLPINTSKTIRRVFKRFGLPWDANITIKSGATVIPKDRPLPLRDVLSSYVELSQPATRKNVRVIVQSIPDETVRHEAESLAGDSFDSEITAKRTSVLDLLEKYPSSTLTIGDFLAMLPQLRLRQYSISSSPLVDPGTVSITWSVLDEESYQHQGKRFLGAASNYLSNLEPGDHVHINVKSSHASFHLPLDIENTPIIMIAAGTGIAPFHGFIQERVKQIEAGRTLAPALLFFGCRDPNIDLLFSTELDEWSKKGVVDPRYAFSRANDKSNGAKYVQDRFWQDRKEVGELFGKGAKVYVCGHSRCVEGVAEAGKRMKKEYEEKAGRSINDEGADEWFRALRNERYMTDAFD
ncbi:MAG: hypothetical protein M1834_008914 [Cirrosporium novae-zelandiae]|nr:MAG: hypothetical protein M1834_008914 [Cirrosporium novae-zelandiae]